MELEMDRWSNLPDHIIVNIMLHLNLHDRYHASMVCRAWQNCFQLVYLWQDITLRYGEGLKSIVKDGYIKCIQQHGHHIKKVKLLIDQASTENRHYACQALEMLATRPERILTSLTVSFTGENPSFYGGSEFVEALKSLFGEPPEGLAPPLSTLVHVDLSGLYAGYDDKMLNILAENHPNLNYLNIQNKMIICKVSPTSILHLVKNCKRLEDLRLYHCSMSEEILQELSEEGRKPIEHLSIVCRREDKYKSELSSDVWQQLVNFSPSLKVSLGFDHTCLLYKVHRIMRPEIPVCELRFETFTRIYYEIKLASAYYSNTLELFVVNTSYSDQLGAALLELSANCRKLKTLYVYCVLPEEIIQKILDNSPTLRESKDYVLKSQADPESDWVVVGVEEGD